MHSVPPVYWNRLLESSPRALLVFGDRRLTLTCSSRAEFFDPNEVRIVRYVQCCVQGAFLVGNDPQTLER
jgi:hypothetical protein